MANNIKLDLSELWKRAAQGDATAQKLLFEELRVRILPLAKQRCYGTRHDPEDLVSDIFEVIWENIGQAIDNPMAYAMRIMHNKFGNLIRSKEHLTKKIVIGAEEEGEDKSYQTIEPADPDPDPLEVLVTKEKAAILAKAISKFKSPYREIFEELLEGGSATEQVERLRKRGISIKTDTLYVYKNRSLGELKGKISYE